MLTCSSHTTSQQVFHGRRTTEPTVVVLFVHFDLLLLLSLGLLGVRVVDGQRLWGDLGSHYRWDRGWGYHNWWRFILGTQTDVTFVQKALDIVREAWSRITNLPSSLSRSPFRRHRGISSSRNTGIFQRSRPSGAARVGNLETRGS